MSSLTNNSQETSEILQLSLNDSALDLLNAAIASHQVKGESISPSLTTTTDNPTEDTNLHIKRELEKDSQTPTAPKRAGRKPLDKSQIPDASLDPKQKRKAQNRAAQRAFRDRKEKYVSELQARIEELEKLNATKDEDLVKENAKLKEMLQKLQEENYALKGAKFTFEFPPPTTTEEPKANDIFLSNDSSSSSAEQSPLSKSHDDHNINSFFTSDPIQFGLIQPDNNNLFHGKDDLFANYLSSTTTPSTTAATDDFLFNLPATNGMDLSSLFGNTEDLFGYNNTQFGLPQTPPSPKDKKQIIMEKLKQAKQEGKHIYQSYQEIQKTCPDFDLDLLCDELKQKAQCSVVGAYPLTDYEVDAFMKCMENK